MLIPQVEFVLEDKQADFLESALSGQVDELGYSGAWGAGKTLVGVCLVAWLRAQHPRAVEVLCRDTMKNVKDTILPVLFEGTGDTPAVLQPGCYEWYKSDEAIRLLGPGRKPLGLIRYRGLGATHKFNLEKLSFRGQTVTGVGIDQCEEISEKQYNNVQGRLRAAGQGLTRLLYWSANPSSPDHYLAKRFGISSGHDPATTPMLERRLRNKDGSTSRLRVYLTNIDDNPHLPADYRARIANLSGVEFLRYGRGMWVASEGVVYDNFDLAKHVRERMSGPYARNLIVIDDGTTKPAAIMKLVVSGDGKRQYQDEVHRPGMLNGEKVAHCVRMRREMGSCEAVVIDPSAASLKLELRKAGFAVINGQNDVIPGITVVREGLAPATDGEPGVTFHNCPKSCEEMGGYMWDPNAKGEAVLKVNDHGPDAVRYGEMHLYSPPQMVFDVKSLGAVEALVSKRAQGVTGKLTHEEPSGQLQDLMIAELRREPIAFEPGEGPMTLWGELDRGRPRTDTDYLVFAVAADGAVPSVVAVAETTRRRIVAQWIKATPPEKLARVAAMLAIWFGEDDEPAPIGYMAGSLSTPGLVLGQHLARLEIPASPWSPTPQQFAESMGTLRAALESNQLQEHDPAVFAVARQYIYANATVMHASLAGAPERRGSWADPLIARAGLWHLLCQEPPEEPEEREAPPNSPEFRRRKRLAEDRRARGPVFG